MTAVAIPTLKRHKYSKYFPAILEDERAALKSDIRSKGVLNPIVLYQEQILDGWKRWSIIEELAKEGVQVSYSTIDLNDILGKACSDENALGYSLSQNMYRGHYNASQRACAAVDAADEARRLRSKAREIGDEPDESGDGDYLDQLARQTGSNRTYINKAMRLKEKSAELFDDVRTGKKTIPEAEAALEIEAHDKPTYKKIQAGEITVKQAKKKIETQKAETNHVEKVYDAQDKLVPERLHKVFATREAGLAMLRDLRKTMREAIELAKRPGGHFIHEQSLQAKAKNFLKDLEYSLPYIVHKKCKGEGCKECRDKGFVSRAIAEGGGNEEKEAEKANA